MTGRRKFPVGMSCGRKKKRNGTFRKRVGAADAQVTNITAVLQLMEMFVRSSAMDIIVMLERMQLLFCHREKEDEQKKKCNIFSERCFHCSAKIGFILMPDDEALRN